MAQVQPITQDRVEAYVAPTLRLLGWLLTMILRLNSAGGSMQLKRLLGRAELAVECLLFLKAVALYGPPPKRRSIPPSTSPGFGRCKRRSLRFFLRSAGVRARNANALTRIAALIDALLNPKRAVDYFVKCIRKGLRASGPAPVAPPADALARDALVAAGASPLDTS